MKAFLAVWGTLVLCSLLFWLAVAWVVIHFVSKFW